MKHIKIMTTALAFAFALSGHLALAKTIRHKPGIRTYDLYTGRSGPVHPNRGNPDGPAGVSAGGTLWNGRSASEWGGG
jgi:hypothetical protein